MNKPFLKWAGGKRWLVGRPEFQLPNYSGRYIEPFLGSGAVFFSHKPSVSTLSDANARLIEVYQVLKSDWKTLGDLLAQHHELHSKEHYYSTRDQTPTTPEERSAQFLYLNRSCWNGLYRVNMQGKFNVPIGTKDWIVSPSDDFQGISAALSSSDILCSDFEPVIDSATAGDLIFADPPYTVAHNFNGFVKYNEKIFSWADQIRLRDSLIRAKSRGCCVVVTNAAHQSITELYGDHAEIVEVNRHSIISGSSKSRGMVAESLIVMS